MSRVAAISTRSLGQEAVLQVVAVPTETRIESAVPGVCVESASLPLGLAFFGGLLVSPAEADLVELHDTLIKSADPGVRVEIASLPLARVVLGGLRVIPPEADLVEVHATLVVRCEGVEPLTAV